MPMEPMMDWMQAWWALGSLLVTVLLVGLIIVGVYLIVRAVRGGDATETRSATAQPRPSAVEILEERYARGEIDDDEFEQRRRHLSG